MSLFSIERYDKEAENVGENTEHSLMDKLLRKSEKRKRRREELKQLRKSHSKEDKRNKNDPGGKKQIDTSKENQFEQPPLNATIDHNSEPKNSGFTFQILGERVQKKRKEVERTMPRWLSQPHTVYGDLQNLTSEIDSVPIVDEHCQNVLRQNNITHYFPIQATVIPYIIKENQKPHPFWRKDVCISATTGSGKTLAYVVPIITVLRKDYCCGIQVVIIAPVQELASQIYNQVIKFTIGTRLKTNLLSGLTPLEVEQKHLMKAGQDLICTSNIVVTTPGRLVEHLHSTPGFSLHNLKFLVMDEADRMMDREKHCWIYHLYRHSEMRNILLRPKKINLKNFNMYPNLPQKILASATMTTDPEKLARIGLLKPTLFSAEANYVIPKGLSNEYCVCNIYEKTMVLYHIILTNNFNRVLCFALTKFETRRLALILEKMAENKFTVGYLSSLDKKNRMVTLKKFENGEINILVSTDALARGIDIPNVECVISFHPAKYVETYVHRVGRTSRAGQPGTAITILHPKQKSKFFETLSKTVQLKAIDLNLEKIQSDYDSKFKEAIAQTSKIIASDSNMEKKKNKKIKYKYKAAEKKTFSTIKKMSSLR